MDNLLKLSLSTYIADKLYHVDILLDKNMLEYSKYPEQVIAHSATRAYKQLINELGTLRWE